MKKQSLKCLRCDTDLEYIMTESIQLGKQEVIFGSLPHLLAGALDVDIYSCPECGKIELFKATEEKEEALPQKKCPQCGKEHDFDYPKCPFCKYEY